MVKLLLVDDEQPILDGLKQVIDWSEIDVEIIGTADNGQTALELAPILKPDIVITDIRMPELSGIELIKGLKEVLPQVKCIILSGYDDFEYAKEAIKYGAQGYLLKPVEEEELKDLVISTRDAILVNNKKNGMLVEINKQLYQSMPFVRNQLMYSIVTGEVKDYHIVTEKMKLYNFGKLPERYICVVVNMEISLNESFTDEDIELVRFAVANITDELVKKYTDGQVFYMFENQVIALIDADTESESYHERVLRDILHYASKFLMVPVTLGVSNIHEGFDDISVSFNEAKISLKNGPLQSGGLIIHYSKKNENANIMLYSTSDIEKDLVNSIICGNMASIPKIADKLFEEMSVQKGLTYGVILSTCKEILLLIKRSIIDFGLDYEKVSVIIRDFLDIERTTLHGLKVRFCLTLESIAKEVQLLNSNGARQLILQIKEYIDNNYENQISLNTISEKFFINPSYVSRLIKKEMGQNFVDYLTNKRLEEAKKLLESSNMKIYEISEKIGYSNPKYFSQLFEKFVRMTPRDYRFANKKN